LNYLLDTNVISELRSSSSESNVVRFVTRTHEANLWVSVITVAELRRGIELLPDGRRKEQLDASISEAIGSFGDRLLPITADVAWEWGRISAKVKRDGFSVGSLDLLLAATARVHDLTLVTRNVRDFVPTGISVYDPWNETITPPNS
jgi:predicted nucleic acid-binding protein